jgi:Na+/H+-dicarboxylate symporter
MNKITKIIKKNQLLFYILLSLIVGFTIGLTLKQFSNTESITIWLKLPGYLFIRCLELLILPVIFVGIISSTSTFSAKKNIRITLICILFIFLTHLISVLTGLCGSLILIKLLNINKNNETLTNTTLIISTKLIDSHQKSIYDIISDILRNIIPKNIVKATTHQEITKLNVVNYIDGTNLLGILFFALLTGLATSVLDDSKVKVFKQFFQSANEIFIQCLNWIILLSPVGICSLIIEAIDEIDSISDSFKKIGLFVVICSGTLIFYGGFVLSALMFIFTRLNPFKYYLHFLEPALLAFASTSGAV